MPLKIQLKKGQKIIINGAVLENASSRTASLLIINNASIMRDADILTPEEAVTPASRVYYSLQCMYLFPEEKNTHLPRFNEYIEGYLSAAPSSKEIIEELKDLVEHDRMYKALKKGHDLIEHEHRVLTNVQERLGEELRHAAGPGESEGSGGVGSDSGGSEVAQGEGRE